MARVCYSLALATAVIAVNAITGGEALAGGDSGQYYVLDLAHRNGQEVLTLKATTDETPLFSCNTLKVYIEYATLRWFFTGPAELTIDNHKQALELLRVAKARNKLVDFGVMGSGLELLNHRDCEASSRGLTVIGDTVYSFYKWP